MAWPGAGWCLPAVLLGAGTPLHGLGNSGLMGRTTQFLATPFASSRAYRAAAAVHCSAVFCWVSSASMSNAMLKLFVDADDAASASEPRADGFYDNVLKILTDSGYSF